MGIVGALIIGLMFAVPALAISPLLSIVILIYALSQAGKDS